MTGIILARVMGPDGRGALAAIQTLPSLIATFSMLGLPDALVYFSASDNTRTGRYLGTSVQVALASSLGFLFVGWIGMPYLLAAQDSATVQAARVYLLLGPIFATAGMPYHTLRAQGEYGWWNVARVLPVLGWLLLVLWFAGNGHLNPITLSQSFLGVYVLALLPIAAIVLHRIPGPVRPDSSLRGPLLRFGLPTVGSTLPQMLSLRLDQVLMALFFSTRRLGLYVAAVAWSSAVTPALAACASVLLPRVAAEEDPRARVAALCRGTRMASTIAILTILPIALVTPLAMGLLFGPEYRSAVPVAMVLVVAAGVIGWALVLEEGIRGIGEPVLVLRCELVALAVTGVSLAGLLGPIGIMGGAIASLIGYSSLACALVVAAARTVGCATTDLWRPQRQETKALLRNTLALVTSVLHPGSK